MSGPVAFWHLLTLRDRHDVLLKQNDALKAQNTSILKKIRGLSQKSMESHGGNWFPDSLAPPEVSPDLIRHIGRLVDDASTKAMEPTIFERAVNWLWTCLVKPIVIVSWGVLLILGIVWLFGL